MIKTWKKKSEVQRLSLRFYPSSSLVVYPPCYLSNPIPIPIYQVIPPSNYHYMQTFIPTESTFMHPSIYHLTSFPFPLFNLSALMIFRGPESASRQPIFPKQTQLQNNTLNIQTAPSRLSPNKILPISTL